jgi:hypothetical protein
MKRITLAACLLLCGCAGTSSSVVTASAPATISVDSQQGGTQELTVGTAPNVPTADNLALPADSAWARLPRAFTAVGLEGATPIAGERSLSLGPVKVTRRLGGQRLSSYLNCGQSLSGPNADSHSVALTVLSKLVPNGSATRLETLVQATATPLVSGGGMVSCNTTGALENRIAAEMRK